MSHNPNMHPGENDADFCRRMGYIVGTKLSGDEGYGETVIQITAIGERLILAKTAVPYNSLDGYFCREATWTLSCRDWRVV
jgi:hypothetical protein